jgi:hypothetical protein
MGSGAMTFIQNFIKIGSDIQKLTLGIYKQTHTQAHRQRDDLISVILFFSENESSLKTYTNK